MINTLNSMADNWWTWQIAMLWQTAVLIGIIWIVDVCIRKWAWPQVRYALWMLVLVKLLIPPTWTSPASITSHIPPLAQKAVHIQIAPAAEEPTAVPDMPVPTTTVTDAAAYEHPQTEPMTTPEPSVATAVNAPIQIEMPVSAVVRLHWKAYAMFTWLAGMAVLSAWLILRLTGLRREHLKSSNGFTLPERFYTQLEEVASKLNLRRLPQVVLTDKVACPAVFGIFHPVLLMPAEKLRNMSRQDTEHILLHELAHIKRGDLFVHAVYMLLQIVYWFNPLLWMVRRPLQNLRELCCDATVARLLKDKTYRYRETLLETARQLLAEPVDPGLGLLGLFENSNWLVTRLQWLEKNTWKNRPLRIATIFALVAVMTTCVLPMGNRQTADINDISSFVKEINGYRIEFVAVNHFEAESGWWRPDGSPYDKQIITEDKSNYQFNYPGYEFIFKIDGVMKPNSIRLDVKGRNQSSGLTVLDPEGLIGWRNHIKPRYKDTTAKIGILGDNWETIDSHTGYGTTNAKVGGKKIIFSPASGSGNEFSITVSDELSYDLGKRIVAVGKDGKVYTGTNIGGLYIDDLHQNTFRFKGIDRSDIKEFQFQTQQYQWVTFKNVSLRPDSNENQAQTWVEDFFKHNYRDITARKTLEWGEPKINDDGNISIRYKYEATIWDKDKIIENKVWTFDKHGKFINVRKVGAEDIYSLLGVQALVEDFCANNYRDITHRETIEWGQPVTHENGNVSIQYKYEATIWDTDTVINNEIYTFDKNGKFISVKRVGLKNLDTYKNIDPDELGITVYKVNKVVSSFPESVDFSLPENTYVMAQRIIAEGNTSAWPEISASGLAARMRKTQKQSQKPVGPERAKKELIVKVLEVYKKGNYAGVIGRNPGLLPSYDTRSFKLENGKWLNRGNSGARTLATARAIVMQGIDYRNWQETENTTNSKQLTQNSKQKSHSEPPTTNYTATLSNGVTVELLGVCDFDLENQQCWQPDGSAIDEPLFVTVSKNGNKQYHTKAHGFIVRTNIPCEIEWQKAVGQTDWFCCSSVVDENGENLGYQNYYGKQIWLDGREQTSLPITVAPEKLQTKAVYDGKYIIGQADERVRFIETYDSADGLKVVFQSDFDDMDIRLDALVKGSAQSIVTAEISTVTDSKGNKNKVGIFKNMGLSQIQNFQFKIRPKMETVTFKNVSLRPGGKTEEEIKQVVASSQKVQGEGPVDIAPAGFEMLYDSKRKTYNLVVSIPNQGDTTIPKHRKQLGTVTY
ncbi:MAG: M56 family metallopeptidase [Planctomycetota bacterium]|jgi:beta-lactamase regulating signal transducer with metallopeptidase domain